MSITPSHIIQYLYCPRYIFYEYVQRLSEHEEKYYKVLKGREMHEVKQQVNADYLRKDLGVTKRLNAQYLTNDLLRGEVDEILELNDGTMAPLDYKFAKWEDKIYPGYRTQLHCYAMLIEENFGLPVRRGFLVYTRSKNRVVEVPIEAKYTEQLKRCIDAILEIIKLNRFPAGTSNRGSCRSCTFRSICPQ